MSYHDIDGNRQWTSRDQNASEYEVGEFLAGLVRLLKPQRVLETGCYYGDTSLAIARALKQNGHGWLYTCDTDEEMCAHVSRESKDLPLIVRPWTAAELVGKEREIDLAFIDHSGDRASTLHFLGMARHGIVTLHDSLRDYKVPAGWQRVRLYTKRGLDIYQCD